MAEETVVKETLSPQMISGGEKLTRHLIRWGLRPTASLWLYSSEDNSWRLIFGLPNLKEKGPRVAYKKIQKILVGLQKPVVSLSDISVIDSNDSLLSSLRKSVYLGGVRLSQRRMDDIYIDDAYIYMARETKILRVFISSPGDLKEERAVVDKVIRELNSTWGDSLNLRLEPISWETHVIPGVGSDPQQVINEQIGDDYDIFIGLFWKRFGTPTPRAGSGTEEEFQRAYSRYCSNQDSLRIMFYFKEAPVSLSEIDPEQLTKINTFRTKLGDKGVLYWTFTDVEGFESLVRMHLARQVQGWQRTWGTTPSSISASFSPDTLDEEELGVLAHVERAAEELEEEPGFLDLVEIATEGMEDVTDIAKRMAHAVNEVGQRFTERTDELQNLGTIDQKPKLQKAKKIINRAALDLEQFTSRIKVELPLFKNAWSDSLNSTSSATSLMISDFDGADSDALREILSLLEDLETSVTGSKDGIYSLRDAISAWPRISSKLNKSKREAIRVLDELVEEFDSALNLAIETRKTIHQTLDQNE